MQSSRVPHETVDLLRAATSGTMQASTLSFRRTLRAATYCRYTALPFKLIESSPFVLLIEILPKAIATIKSQM